MATVNIIGVLENGPQVGQPSRSLNAPDNPRVALRLIQQTSLTVNLQVLNASGMPVDLTGGTTTLVVRKMPGGTAAITKTGAAITPPNKSCVSFQFNPNDSLPQRMQFGRWCFSIAFKDGDGNVNDVVPLSPFILEPST